MNFTRAIFCLLLLILCAGCGSATQQASTMPVLPTAEPTATATLRPTRTVVPTATVVLSTPTSGPTFEPTLPALTPLSEDGPWFLISKGTYYNGPRGVIDPVLMNVDGTAWEPLNVPRPVDAKEDEYTWWYADQVPGQPLIMVRGHFSEYSPDCEKHSFFPDIVDPYQDFLSFVKLPENKVVRNITLLGQEAKKQINIDDCKMQGDNIPPVLGVTHLPSRHIWSKDGRYLVFPAAPEGPAADLYVYDVESDSLHRLTKRQNNPDILGWSPDGQTLIYQGVKKIAWYHSQVKESTGLYAVSMAGTDRLLYQPKNVPGGMEWLSSSQFIVSDYVCDPWGTSFCTYDLVLVDLSTGVNEVIYTGTSIAFYYYRTDPVHNLLLIVNPPADMPGAEAGEPLLLQSGIDSRQVQGIYLYDLEARKLRPLLLQNTPDSIRWDEEYQAFVLKYEQYNDDLELTSKSHKLLRFSSDQNYSLEELDMGDGNYVSTSPDGQWSIGEIQGEYYIMNGEGQPVQKVMREWGSWAPDSSALIQFTVNVEAAETIMTVYNRDIGWQNTLTRHLTEGYEWWGMWINASPSP